MRERRTVNVVVPPGVDHHHQLKVAGQGDAGRRGGAAGDIRVRLNIAPHPLFTRDGNDVHVSVGVPLSTAVLGGSVTVPTLSGEAVLKVDAGTQPGDRRVMRGKGVKDVSGRSGLQGSQYVTFNIKVPTDLTPQQRSSFELFAAQRGERQQQPDSSTGSAAGGAASASTAATPAEKAGAGSTTDSSSTPTHSSSSSSSSAGFFSSLFGSAGKDGKDQQQQQQTKKQTAGGGNSTS